MGNSNDHISNSSDQSQPIWLSLEQIRKRERMGRARVIEAMETGELPFERRGRIRYARVSDVIKWEEARLHQPPESHASIRSDLKDLL